MRQIFSWLSHQGARSHCTLVHSFTFFTDRGIYYYFQGFLKLIIAIETQKKGIGSSCYFE
jgi:hypothetical protein